MTAGEKLRKEKIQEVQRSSDRERRARLARQAYDDISSYLDTTQIPQEHKNIPAVRGYLNRVEKT